jgi:hypothetical protein
VGKAYGKGIYFAANAQTSLGYCVDRFYGGGVPFGGGSAGVNPNGTSWPHSIFGSRIVCIALCEIIDNKKEFTYAVI